MKKFRFPLRSVATVRNLHEIRAREDFSQAVRTFTAAERKLEELRHRVADLESLLRSGRLERFRPADQQSFIAAIKEETARLTAAVGELATARAALDQTRQRWLESRRDLRLLENLEQKARAAHQRDVERENQAALDDRANALAARGGANALSPA